MTGLSKITDRIMADAQADARAILAEADEEVKAIALRYQQQAAAIREKLDAAAEREAAGMVSRAKSGAAMAERNTVLDARSTLIDRAFERARNEIRNLPADKYLDLIITFLLSILKRMREEEKINRELYGEEDAPAAEHYDVLLCESDLEKYRGTFMDAVRRRLIGNAELGEKLRLSSTPVDIDGGFILRCGDIEINASLSMLIAGVRATHEVRVSHILFD